MSISLSRLTLTTVALAAVLMMIAAQPAKAGVAQGAYNSCQSALKQRYGQDTRVSLKRTSERGSKVTVKARVKTSDDAFTSTCVVHSSGQITLTGEDGRLFEAVAANTSLEG